MNKSPNWAYPEDQMHEPDDVFVRIPYYPKGSIVFWCPGCKSIHRINVEPCGKECVWEYNGDPKKPTVSPSVLQYGSNDPEMTVPRCHSFIRNGQIQFLSDCGHELAGQTIPLIPYDEAPHD